MSGVNVKKEMRNYYSEENKDKEKPSSSKASERQGESDVSEQSTLENTTHKKVFFIHLLIHLFIYLLIHLLRIVTLQLKKWTKFSKDFGNTLIQYLLKCQLTNQLVIIIESSR